MKCEIFVRDLLLNKEKALNEPFFDLNDTERMPI